MYSLGAKPIYKKKTNLVFQIQIIMAMIFLKMYYFHVLKIMCITFSHVFKIMYITSTCITFLQTNI